MIEALREQTIRDFGEQWTQYRAIDGYYGSVELLADFFEPILPLSEIRGQRVAEIGSGTGRIVNMLLAAGADHVVAVEPSDAYDVLEAHLAGRHDRVTCLRLRGDELPAFGDLDMVFSVGVLHHIPDPDSVVQAAWHALRPGGKLAIWLYGREGNRLYLAIAQPLRMITRRLPHVALAALVRCLDVPLALYIHACRYLPLPMRRYMTSVMGKLAPDKRRIGIYDQLNPAHARYYTFCEAYDLLERNGFADIRYFHRHGYSWSLVGTRPDPAPRAGTGDVPARPSRPCRDIAGRS